MKNEWNYDGGNPTYEELTEILKQHNIFSKKTLVELLESEIEQKDNTGKYLNWCHKFSSVKDKLFLGKSNTRFSKKVEKDIFEYIKTYQKDILHNELSLNVEVDITLDMIKKTRYKKDKLVEMGFLSNKMGISKDFGFKSYDDIYRVLKRSDDEETNSKYCKKLSSIEEAKKATLKETKFLENFCSVYNISLDWFLYTHYKSERQLDEVTLESIRPRIKQPANGPQLSVDEHKKLQGFFNKTNETLETKIKDLTISHEKSEIYYLTILINAFEKGVETSTLLEYAYSLEKQLKEQLKEQFEGFYDKTLILCKAKLFSKNKQDKKAIEVLEKFQKDVENHTNKYSDETINEINNVLAASYKRRYFKDRIEDDLEKAIGLYKQSFENSKQLDYYPLINKAYLQLISNNFDQGIKNILQHEWSNIKKDSTWWFLISDVEFYMLMSDWDGVDQKLKKLPDIKLVSDFNLHSTIRQLEVYIKFAPKYDINHINSLINKLEEMRENKDLGADIFIA